MLRNVVKFYRNRSREKRKRVFLKKFSITNGIRLLDLGSETGANINFILSSSRIKPENVYLADINKTLLLKGANLYGYNSVYIDEGGKLPFPDKYFDIVYCSSVIEHVTVPKNKVWNISSREFLQESKVRQLRFAKEIRRVGRGYFVQTPNKYFFIESHSWLPFLGLIPRRFQVKIIKIFNSFWVKKTIPDFRLLPKMELKYLFPDSEILSEKSILLTKSIMAIKTRSKK